VEPKTQLQKRQEAAKRAHDRMLEALIGYAPCHKLSVEDVLFVARFAQTLAFDATEQAA
jgi:hypothetical protein